MDRRLAFSGLLCLLWIAAPTPAHAQSASPTVKTVSDTVTLDPSGAVEVDNVRGSITVTTWDRAEVGYEVRIEPANEEGDVSLTSLDVERTENKLDLDPDFPWRVQIPGVVTISPGGTERAHLHYTLQLPRAVDLEIDDHASTIDVSGPNGRLDVDTHSGPITATGLSGGLDLDLHSGDAQVSFTRLTASVSIDAAEGRVWLVLPAGTGFTLDAEPDEPDLLTASDAFPLPAPSSEGAYEGDVNEGGPTLSLDTHTATVELRTP